MISKSADILQLAKYDINLKETCKFHKNDISLQSENLIEYERFLCVESTADCSCLWFNGM